MLFPSQTCGRRISPHVQEGEITGGGRTAISEPGATKLEGILNHGNSAVGMRFAWGLVWKHATAARAVVRIHLDVRDSDNSGTVECAPSGHAAGGGSFPESDRAPWAMAHGPREQSWPWAVMLRDH